MYKVILVDDEYWSLVAIQKVFNWNKYGFEVVASTTKSLEALDLIKKYRPDVVITDIRMPDISGLELIEFAKQNGINTQFVIVSGYGEFNYAQQALQSRAFDYKLKPLSQEDAEAILLNLVSYFRAKTNVIEEGNKDNMFTTDVLSGVNMNFVELLAFVDAHYTSTLQLKDLAERFFINSTYCCELFRKTTGKTFMEFVTKKRMAKAIELLTATNLTTEEITKEVGYKDYYHFCKLFKKYTGCTPRQYKISHAQRV